MKIYNLSLIVLILFLGCSAVELKDNKYEVKYIDRYSFDDVNLIELYNISNNSIYYLLSYKIIDFNKRDFEKLKLNEQYTFYLQKISKPTITKSRSVDEYSRYERKIWFNDTFKVDVYSSNNILDLFIKKE